VQLQAGLFDDPFFIDLEQFFKIIPDRAPVQGIFGNLLGNNNGVTPGLTSDNVDANDKAFGATLPYLASAH
jgi:hypothetical protein